MMSAANWRSIEADVRTARELSQLYPNEQREVFVAVLVARLVVNSPATSEAQQSAKRARDAKPLAPSELFAQLRPGSEVSRVLAGAFFLDKYRGVPDFTAEEIRQCLVEAKVPAPRNVSLAALQNSRKGLMAQRQKSGRKISWYLTLSGIREVEGMLSAVRGDLEKIQNR
jgi:hypothetical protein